MKLEVRAGWLAIDCKLGCYYSSPDGSNPMVAVILRLRISLTPEEVIL
jgi:hypothetical protein